MGGAEWKKGSHNSGEMSTAEKLFGDEAMGYTARNARGAALGYPEQVGGVTDLLDGTMRSELGAESLEEQRYLMRGGGNAPGAPKKETPTAPRTKKEDTELMLTVRELNYKPDENVVPVDISGKPPIGDPIKGLTTPVKPHEFGIVGMLPGGQKSAPGAPQKVSKRLNFVGEQKGGVRKTRRGGRRTQRGGRRRTTKRGTKSFLNIRVTGRIRMKQRHRQ